MPEFRSSARRLGVVVLAAALVGGALAGCSSTTADSATDSNDGTVVIGAVANGAATETTLRVSQVDSIRAELPREVRDSGRLSIGIGALPSGYPPLAYIGTDQRTLTGVEPDLARLVAAVLGLKPEFTNSTWENLFVGLDSGRVTVGFSNITVTEERKDKYDFASYRKDELAFEVPKNSTWNFDGNYETLAGKTVAVGAGTNQERLLLEWRDKLAAQGKALRISHFADSTGVYLALASGQIDAFLGPNPSSAYHVRQTANTPKATRIAGTYSGAGSTLQGIIAATTKKGNGLVTPLADAINHLIASGDYQKLLDAWSLQAESVPTAQVNPPGLPRDNS